MPAAAEKEVAAVEDPNSGVDSCVLTDGGSEALGVALSGPGVAEELAGDETPNVGTVEVDFTSKGERVEDGCAAEERPNTGAADEGWEADEAPKRGVDDGWEVEEAPKIGVLVDICVEEGPNGEAEERELDAVSNAGVSSPSLVDPNSEALDEGPPPNKDDVDEEPVRSNPEDPPRRPKIDAPSPD